MIEPGTTFAGYVIERRLGAGGMGEVYVGRHPRLPRSDAIKVLGAQVSGDAQFRARFHREAELAAGLSHPAIVQVFDQGEDDGRLWISMQLIDGTDVGKLAAAGPIPLPEVARIIGAVADALDFAGARGLVHRDVKPANILVSTAGHVMLTDFGIARMGVEASDLTGTGMTVGTLNYASPEQLQGDAIDTRSDQYSLAATAYHLLAGAPPFANTNAVKVITGHLSSPVPPLSTRRAGLPATADTVLTRAMAKDPAQRYGSSREFAAALQSALLSGHSDVTLHARHVPAGLIPQTMPPVGPLLSAPVPRSTEPIARASWMVSAAVITACLLIVGVGRQLAWTQSSGFFAVSALGCIGAAVYVGVTGLSRKRSYIAAAIFVFLAIVWALQAVGLPAIRISIVAVLLGPIAWGVGRRRGARWAWSLLAAPVLFFAGVAGLALVRMTDEVWLVMWFVVVFTMPMLLAGLLGWLIDWLQHRRETSPGAPSHPMNGTFDPGAPTQLRG